VIETLGRGGMGLVLHVRDGSGRDLAMKLLTRRVDHARILERFRREAQVTASLRHVGIVGVHDVGIEAGWPYIVYEYVPGGQTLEDVFEAGDSDRSVRLVLQVAEAMGHAHAQGVIHRDLKPPNVLVTPEGQARVADFGLAQAVGLERLTLSGAMVGTPHAMSPEQITGDRERYGPPTDVWALGALLYRALTGEDPFQGKNLIELAAQIADVEPATPSSRVATVSSALEAVCLKALRKAPEDRYPHGAAFAEDLRAALGGSAAALQERFARRLLTLAGGASLALVVTLAWWAADRARPDAAGPPPVASATLSAKEARRARGEAKQLERLGEAIELLDDDPDRGVLALARFEREDLASLSAAQTRLREAQAAWAGALQASVAAGRPDFDVVSSQLEVLAALAEALPPDAPPFPGANAAADRLLAAWLGSEGAGVTNVPAQLGALARTGARVEDEQLGESWLTLISTGTGGPGAKLDGAQSGKILLALARLDAVFRIGLNVAGGLSQDLAPEGRGPWEDYVRLRIDCSEGDITRETRDELRRFLRDPPDGFRLGPRHKAELANLASQDLPPAERLGMVEEGLKADPSFMVLHNARVIALCSLRRLEEALAAYAEAEACWLARQSAGSLDLGLEKERFMVAGLELHALTEDRVAFAETLEELRPKAQRYQLSRLRPRYAWVAEAHPPSD
jgi:hypothetical protein